jgi:type 1 fimbria pilin
MKKTLIAAALVLFTGSALAEQNAVLQVQGKLTAASCTPELSNGGEVDYGYIHLGTLSPTEVNPLGFKDIELTINCTAPTKVAWTSTDNETDSQPSPPIAVTLAEVQWQRPQPIRALGWVKLMMV